MTGAPATRRGLLRLGAAAALAGFAGQAALSQAALADDGWNNIDVSGSSPPLRLDMARAGDGRPVTQSDFRGKAVLLYFGYTFCPDVCPLTLGNVDQVLKRLGPLAADVRVLFVTVDPNRDTLPVLADYTAAFAPQIVGLRGSPDALERLARRYRIAYSVTPATPGHPYAVTHSSAIYVFDSAGAARLLIPSMASRDPDIAGTAADLRRIIEQGAHPPGVVSRMLNYILGLV